ncbi:MAG: GNAT family N-acetyltransferase [Deltaproteobacteria bacterium]|nr:GNAT family N-acetyltransferase [Deltaproteobacteria bacterium]
MPTFATELREFHADRILRDGGSIRLRAIRADDKQRLLDHFASLSASSVYFRFFGAKKRLSEEELRRFTELDFVDRVGFVATLGSGAREKIIGVGRYAVVSGAAASPRRAEVAFAISDAHQGRGVGTVLLEELARAARRGGIEEFEADVLGENNRMLEVFAKSGFVVKRSVGAGVVHLSFSTAETERSAEVALERERAAAAHSIARLLRPRSVAVVGASRRPGSIGHTLVANLRQGGFRGAIYPVNPQAREIDGLRCHPSLAAIGAAVDLVVVAVPPPAVAAAVGAAAQAGAAGVVVISAGFAEASSEGRDAQQQLRELVRGTGMRLVGPNCLGILNTDPEIALNATFAPGTPPIGNLGALSQSGALGLALLDLARERGLGVSSFVSVGNKADVSGNDLLCYWLEDPRTAVVLLYLESFGNPRKFARLAPELARRKPIVAVKAGRSAVGRRAASSHSGALASLDVAVDALFEQAGVIRADTTEQLFDVAALLATQPLPPGPRVAVVTNAGGPGILFADAAEGRGLEFPSLAAPTVERLRGFLPRHASLANPIDMIASAGPEEYARAIELVGADPNVDALVAINVPTPQAAPNDVARAIARGAAAIDARKPVLSVFVTSQHVAPADAERRGRIPVYRFPENAVLSLAAAERYASWRRRPRGEVWQLDRTAHSAIRAVVDRAAAQGGSGWLSARDVAMLLLASGVDTAAAEQAAAADAVATAERLGYPLVAKAVASGVLHKSDVGGVILGLRSARDVAEAVRSLEERMTRAGARLEGVLLQREVRGGIEALVGVTVEPTFGPLVACGFGGRLVEVVNDVAFRLTPVSDVDAREMIDGLRLRRLLEGFRGAPPGDREALVELVRRVSALVEAAPEIAELDLNPVLVLEPGRGAVVVDARIRIAAQGAEVSPAAPRPSRDPQP